MRILSWNIERGYEIRKIISVLLELQPDVLLLQEVDRGVGRTGNQDIAEIIQNAFPDYHMHWSLEFQEIPSIWRRIIPIGGVGGGLHGNIILSRYPILSRQTLSLPTNKKLLWDGTTIIPELFEPRVGSRIAQICELDTPGGNVFVANTHLENWRSSQEHRILQFKKIIESYLKEKSKPGIIAGDMNTISGFIRFDLNKAVRETKSFRIFAKGYGLVDPFSDTDWTGRFGIWNGKIDWLFTNREEKISQKFVGPGNLSDHAYLCIDIDLD